MSGCCERLLPCVALLQGLGLMCEGGGCVVDNVNDNDSKAGSESEVVMKPDTPDITEDDSADDVASCGSGQEMKMAAAGQAFAAAADDAADADGADGMVLGSCLDLKSLAAGGAVAGDGGLLLLLLQRAGSGSGSGGVAENNNNFDCMSASEATGLLDGVGEGCGGSGGAGAAAAEAEMGEVSSSVCV